MEHLAQDAGNIKMNPIRKLFKMFQKSKPKSIRINQQIGIIKPTKVSIENNTVDKFNKVIVIRAGVELIGNEIRWGRIIREEPYSEEKIKAMKQIREIPIVSRKFDSDIDFFKEADFGEVQTLI